MLKKSPICLLVLEDVSAVGGIQTVADSLVTELALRCEKIVWVLPQYKIKKTQDRLLGCQSIYYESLHASRWNRSWFFHFIAKFIGKISNPSYVASLGFRFEKKAKILQLKKLINKHSVTHLLNIAVFNQPYPDVGIPTYGIIYDTNYSKSWKEECEKNLIDWAMKATELFTISEWSKSQILITAPCANNKLNVVNLAVQCPHISIRKLDNPSTNSQATFLYPASFNPHKNHLSLIRALYDLYLEKCIFKMYFCGHNTHLLFSSSILSNPELEKTRMFINTVEADFRNFICPLGMVEKKSLEGLFHNANYVFLPTLYEGFGLPLSEAIVRGVPVLCSDIPPFREQVELYKLEKYVTFVKGFDSLAWREAIKNNCNMTIKKNLKLPEIIKTFKRWTWSDVADKYISVFVRSMT